MPDSHQPPPDLRIGQGFDVHPFAEGRELWLGGVRIDHPRGLAGHSDADVLCHALCDALLGAVGEGDLGRHFPDTDPAWKDAAGLDLLAGVRQILEAGGWAIGNADLTLLSEEPRIAPHVPTMQDAMGKALGVDPSAISVKATTLEGLGPLGRGEGIAALAVALVRRP